MSKAIRQLVVYAAALIAAWASAGAQPQQTSQLNVCHAGSVSGAFTQVENQFKLQNPNVTIKDSSGGSLDMVRQLANGLQECDVYATADYANIALLLKPAGLADYNIVFAQGRMVLGYLATNPNAKGIAGSGNFDPPDTIPEAVPNWYEILLAPGVKVGGVHPFLDPGSYRSHLIFQLAQTYYKVPNLYNNLLRHYATFSLTAVAANAGSPNQINLASDFQFSYEHSAQATAKKNPDYRYVYLPDSIDLSNSTKNSYYSQSAIAVPGLGIPGTAPSVSIPGTRVAWGVTVLNKTPNLDNAIKFLQLLLGSAGTRALTANGPTPITPALVSASDFLKLPASLKPFVKSANVFP
jgi:molybdate/tungstate transport system substrate-binding protein